MIRSLPTIKEDSLLVLDTEYDKQRLVQFGAVLYRRVRGELFQLENTFNLFFDNGESLTYGFQKFTGITQDVVEKEGVQVSPKEYLNQYVFEEGCLIIGHSLKNDILVLKKSGIDLKNPTLCTQELYKKNFKEEIGLNVVNSMGYSHTEEAHDALTDARATLELLSFLLHYEKIKEELQ